MRWFISVILLLILNISLAFADPFENNNTLLTAANVGIIPGVHLTGTDISSTSDQDWYRVELLRNDNVDIAIMFTRSAGNLQFKITDKQGNQVALSSPSGDSEVLHLTNIIAGTYYVCVYGISGASNTYDLQIEPGAGSTTRVFYVNDSSLTSDIYAWAIGNNSNNALTPQTPKATAQNVLDNYDLGPGDIILIDTGTYSQGTVIGVSDEGIICAGSPYGTILNSSGTVFDLIDADHNLLYGFIIYGSTGIYSHNSGINSSSDNVYRANTFYSTSSAIQLYKSQNEYLLENTMTGVGSYGVLVSDGATNIIEKNIINHKTNGIYVGQYESQCKIRDNKIFDSTTGIYIHNNSSNSELSANDVYQNLAGIESMVSTTLYYRNRVHDNTTGIKSSGIIGPSNWSSNQANMIYNNTTGCYLRGGGTVQFNKIYSNSVGISVSEDNVNINHNLIYRNTTQAVLLSDGDNVQIVSNTIYSPTGDLVKIQSDSSNVTIKNNIFWATAGYDLYVAVDSQSGFSSDYNNLFKSGSGKLIWWQKDFLDVYDWQAETDYDSHSIGCTSVNPTLDDPCFVDLASDDYRLKDQISTSIDQGEPGSLFDNEPQPNGERINLGAYGNTPDAGTSQSAYISIEYPNFYTDCETNRGQFIVWRTYDASQPDKEIAGKVNIDLYEQGVGKVADIAEANGIDGSIGWIPASLGIIGNSTKRYFIHIESVSNPAIVDNSREYFSLVPHSPQYYIDDNSDDNDEYTIGAVGSNRNTGHTTADPKASLVAVIRAYDLGPGDIVYVDTGNYLHFRNIVLSGDLAIGDDEGMTITGPTNLAKKAILTRANKNAGTTVIEIDKGDYITLRNLSLSGAERGIYAHASSYLTCSNLSVYSNKTYGVRLDSDVQYSSVKNCDIFGNENTGISATGSSLATAAIIQKNKVHDNGSTGVGASGYVQILENTVNGHTGNNAQGISANSHAVIKNNIIFNNYTGISSSGSGGAPTLTGNRIYKNLNRGIDHFYGGNIISNVVYSNQIGIYGSGGYFTGHINNNLVYANASGGIVVYYGNTGASIVNNTVYQDTGDALQVISNTQNLLIRNNIFWTRAGNCINIDTTSQTGFNSDYNLLYASGTGKIAYWQGRVISTLAEWQSAAFVDKNSLSQNPLFADPNGADEKLGYLNPSQDGRDDVFHVMSTNGRVTGSIAPVLDTASGLPAFLPNSEQIDVSQSPTIDRGQESYGCSNEPSPNGGYINLGADGNTPFASKSPSQYIMTFSPDGGEVWPENQTVAIKWRSHDTNGTVNIDLLEQGNPSPILHIANNVANNGAFDWLIPTSLSPGTNYIIRVTRNDGSIYDVSNTVFQITAPIFAYYVNDSSQNDDEYTTVIGNNANSGLSPESPKASIRAILDTYDLNPGDIIYVDTGNYLLETNIIVTAQDAGVRIVGAINQATVLNRGNTASGCYVFELRNADGITLEHLSITGGQYGIWFGEYNPASNLDNDNVVIKNNRIYSNSNTGIYVNSNSSGTNDNDNVIIRTNEVYLNSTGIYHSHDGPGLIEDNVIYGNTTGISADSPGVTVRGNEVYGNSSTGISAGGTGTLVCGNIVYGHNGTNNSGIFIGDNAIASENEVFDNYNGMYCSVNNPIVRNNRVYNNRNYGIYTNNGTMDILSNVVYSNSVGIYTGYSGSFFNGHIENNLVYANTNGGLVVYQGGTGSSVMNNTVYQEVGDALRVTGSTQNLSVRNNIFWVKAGYGINVDSTSQVGFDSNYNLYRCTAAGKMVKWGNTEFNNLADWTYELGFDKNSLLADPCFIDIDGTDNILGFSGVYAGSIQVVDSGSAGFTTDGTWTSVNYSSSYGGSYLENTTGAKAHWTFEGLTSGTTYEVAVTWRSGGSSSARYKVINGSHVLMDRVMSQGVAPDDFTDGGISWERIGYYTVDSNTLNVDLYSVSVGTLRADAIRIRPVEGDRGSDDNFYLQASSPGIDTGDMLSYYLNEPQPNGGRINLGCYGNTADATTSAATFIQITKPGGLDKYEEGQSIPLEWRSYGLSSVIPVALINVGKTSNVGCWLADKYYVTYGSSSSFTSFVTTSGFTNPAPAAVYQSYRYASSGIGNKLNYSLPVPDGIYTLRLHFVEPTYTTAGSRKFDININGNCVRQDFDIFAQAGGRYVATALSYNVTAAGGTGIGIELVNKTSGSSAYAILCGIELTIPNPSGFSSPTAKIQFSPDGGTNWVVLDSNSLMDYLGYGSMNWISNTLTSNGRFQISSNDIPGVEVNSPGSLQVPSSSGNYYINIAGDGILSDNEYTIAPGSNANDGKSPATPMASLRSLLAAYDLDPNDTIYVDTGTYTLLDNITIEAQDAGVRIVGAINHATVLNRGNTASGCYVFELRNADGVTLEHLSITGGQYGIWFGEFNPASDLDNDNVVIKNNRIYSNSNAGVYVNSGGSAINNDNVIIRSNEVYLNNTGIFHSSDGPGIIEDNIVYGNSTGISAGSGGLTVRGNEVYVNSSTGIYAGGTGTLISDNIVYGHNGTSDCGISVGSSAVANKNEVFDNYNGIYSNAPNSVMEGNRVYNNINYGIRTSGDALSNAVYSNSVGIYATDSPDYSGDIENNLVYANTNGGIIVSYGDNGARVANNTVYQEVGDALQVLNNTADLQVRNNIFWVKAGYGINVDSTSKTGFNSNYNIFYTGTYPMAYIGYWNGNARDTLNDWQTASLQDSQSQDTWPQFVEIAGADNIMGYTTQAGGYDGGRDDNFCIAIGSSAIDRADSWASPHLDIAGNDRADDPGTANIGTIDYYEQQQPNSYFESGTAKNWKNDNAAWTLTLPFTFSFYGVGYTTVYVSSNGFIQFATSTGASDSANNPEDLKTYKRIAPLWDDIKTNGTGDDIFVDTSVAGYITIRWNATEVNDGGDTRFSVTLSQTGEIIFNYGPGNATLTPTVGISNGDGKNYIFTNYDGKPNLADCNSIAFVLAPGFKDIGAYEYLGGIDTIPPEIIDTEPNEVDDCQTVVEFLKSITIKVSETLNPIDAMAFANYDLRSPGPNGIFDDADDVIYDIDPNYVARTDIVTLEIGTSYLSTGTYRLTVFGDSMHDLAGNRLDGDSNSIAGGNYVRIFHVDLAPLFLNADINEDFYVNSLDLVYIANYWLYNNCSYGSLCHAADIAEDGHIDLKDFVIFASQWLMCTNSQNDNCTKYIIDTK